jgi:hypothetical protein
MKLDACNVMKKPGAGAGLLLVALNGLPVSLDRLGGRDQ